LELAEREQLRKLRKEQTRGPLPDPELMFRPEAIATLKALYELDGKIPKVAVEKVQAQYGVNRQQVFAACRQFENARAELEGLDPTWRRALIAEYESMWAPKRRRRPRRRRF
jgi:hypothetical protein